MIDDIIKMFDVVSGQEHGSIVKVLLIGFAFGAIILYSRLDKFEKMAGFMIFEDTLVPRMAMTTVALSSVGFYFLVESGYATYNIKPTMLGGLIIGGILFGIGLVILGKCPSAFLVSVSEGRLDALVGVIGGMFGGYVFTIGYPYIQQILGPDLGKIRVPDFFTEHSLLIVFTLSGILLTIAFLLPTIEYEDPADINEKNK
ncbi:YeeE/YedE thiosulfate transporter family protein [Sulfurovum sp. XTW-4]|uniref:YeeE/YedE thiosulfate transporter family protein n=1 Tax=Sulfurovum xiamenensis TaxID=3019066 RepID=A0ABT7QT68_9BACT|nr:YeeE/YedE thiosulfate transporter family protein [Sulfurovum xiamenensis]MDM5264280.1 YeeE/YedE thiosulfate transporter family protein [Sulfurovum xiamenensis]